MSESLFGMNVDPVASRSGPAGLGRIWLRGMQTEPGSKQALAILTRVESFERIPREPEPPQGRRLTESGKKRPWSRRTGFRGNAPPATVWGTPIAHLLKY
jgi:hypothetical protein